MSTVKKNKYSLEHAIFSMSFFYDRIHQLLKTIALTVIIKYNSLRCYSFSTYIIFTKMIHEGNNVFITRYTTIQFNNKIKYKSQYIYNNRFFRTFTIQLSNLEVHLKPSGVLLGLTYIHMNEYSFTFSQL